MIAARYAHMAWEALHLPSTVVKVEGHYIVRAMGSKPYRCPPWDGSTCVEFDRRVGAVKPFWP